MRKPIILPRLVFIKTWEREGYDPHPVIGADDYWMSDEAKERLWAGVDASLTEAGLAENGLLDPDFRAIITVLAEARREFYAWVSDVESGDTGGVLVCARGSEGVRLLRDDNMVLIDRIPSDQLSEHFIETLPEVGAAPVAPIRLPQALYSEDAPPKAEHYELEIETRYAPDDPAERLRELMHAKRTGLHQMYAAVRDRSGERTRSTPMTAIDIAGLGRVLTYVSEPPNTERQINCVAGTWLALVDTLDATQAGLEY